MVVGLGGLALVADQANHRVRAVTPAWLVSTLAGIGAATYGDGVGASAYFYNPTGLALAPSGQLLLADQANQRIRAVSPAGAVLTFADSGSATSADGLGTAASF